MRRNLTYLSLLAYFDYKENGGFPKPPSYNVATTLPSYDEAERTKAEAHVPLVAGRVSVPLLQTPRYPPLWFCQTILYSEYNTMNPIAYNIKANLFNYGCVCRYTVLSRVY